MGIRRSVNADIVMLGHVVVTHAQGIGCNEIKLGLIAINAERSSTKAIGRYRINYSTEKKLQRRIRYRWSRFVESCRMSRT